MEPNEDIETEDASRAPVKVTPPPGAPAQRARLPFGMIRCPLCEEPVAREAALCMHCGAKLKKPNRYGVFLALAVMVVLVPIGVNYYRNPPGKNFSSALAPGGEEPIDVEFGSRPKGSDTPPAAAPAAAPGSSAAPPAASSPSMPISIAYDAVLQVVARDRTGSCFVVSKDGYVITAAHVIEDAPAVELHGKNGAIILAERVEVNVDGDVALLKMKSAWVGPVISLGDAGSIKPGDECSAIGYPLGLTTAVVTRGVVSAAPAFLPRHSSPLIQIDASINPGNSGGPLLDANGHAVGVVAAKIAGAESMNYASPINYASHFQLLAGSLPPSTHFDEWVAQAKSDPERMKGTAQWASVERLQVLGVGSDDEDFVVFAAMTDAAGHAGVTPASLTVLVDGTTSEGPLACVTNLRVTDSMFESGPTELSKKSGIKIDGPYLTLSLPCAKLAGKPLLKLRVEVRSDVFKKPGIYTK